LTPRSMPARDPKTWARARDAEVADRDAASAVAEARATRALYADCVFHYGTARRLRVESLQGSTDAEDLKAQAREHTLAAQAALSKILSGADHSLWTYPVMPGTTTAIGLLHTEHIPNAEQLLTMSRLDSRTKGASSGSAVADIVWLPAPAPPREAPGGGET